MKLILNGNWKQLFCPLFMWNFMLFLYSHGTRLHKTFPGCFFKFCIDVRAFKNTQGGITVNVVYDVLKDLKDPGKIKRNPFLEEIFKKLNGKIPR